MLQRVVFWRPITAQLRTPVADVFRGAHECFLQVASQQGVYLARLFSRGFEFSASVPQKSSIGDEHGGAAGVAPAGGASSSDPEGKDSKVPLSEKLGLSVVKGKFAKPFQFLNLGILAYTGAGGALAQVQVRVNGDCSCQHQAQCSSPG